MDISSHEVANSKHVGLLPSLSDSGGGKKWLKGFAAYQEFSPKHRDVVFVCLLTSVVLPVSLLLMGLGVPSSTEVRLGLPILGRIPFSSRFEGVWTWQLVSDYKRVIVSEQ